MRLSLHCEEEETDILFVREAALDVGEPGLGDLVFRTHNQAVQGIAVYLSRNSIESLRNSLSEWLDSKTDVTPLTDEDKIAQLTYTRSGVGAYEQTVGGAWLIKHGAFSRDGMERRVKLDDLDTIWVYSSCGGFVRKEVAEYKS